MTLKHACVATACAAVVVLITSGATAARPAAPAGVGLAQIAEPVAKADWPARKAVLQSYGEQFHTAWDLYEALRRQAKGGRKLTWTTIPDWSGVYARAVSSLRYDLDQADDFDESKMPEPPTAKLTPAAHDRYIKQIKDALSGKEYDAQLSACLPAGVPRWFTEPYLRDFAISPGQTWLMNELANETRRIYTDGRGHPKPDDTYPTFEGDSIGFWVGDKLVVHTNGSEGAAQELGQKGHRTGVFSLGGLGVMMILRKYRKRPSEIRMRRALLAWLGCIGAAVLAMQAYAHHSSVMFDDKKMIELTGVVKEFQYANPHAWLIVTVKNEDGTSTTWGFEGPAGPSVLMRAGIHKGDFPPGTAVKISGHPMRDGRPAAQWIKVIRLSDGKEFDPRQGF